MITLALTWLTVALGLASKNVEAASNLPMPLMILPFLGSGFVPTDSMPVGLRLFAEYQPFTPIIETLRGLLLGTPIGYSTTRRCRLVCHHHSCQFPVGAHCIQPRSRTLGPRKLLSKNPEGYTSTPVGMHFEQQTLPVDAVNDGNKRQTVEIHVAHAGPDLQFATAEVAKSTADGSGSSSDRPSAASSAEEKQSA
jgi:hypothetical protein